MATQVVLKRGQLCGIFIFSYHYHAVYLCNYELVFHFITPFSIASEPSFVNLVQKFVRKSANTDFCIFTFSPINGILNASPLLRGAI